MQEASNKSYPVDIKLFYQGNDPIFAYKSQLHRFRFRTIH
jgi:hypothetical protein